ncbi:NDP-hexose 2,3-dehydratase [Streptomyces sp. AS58]|uniref:NDP-hexose 2,3-dehydratase n=1 Tax=Streptomyces cadmiisoli TaxID=2184053 RepID=A0A2Z4IXL8_9ACTN|nr:MULTISPECIES: NDP-hexose 2,3-dehydratase family protein [Streptomyces]AWW37570.1 NDP-hexose 2,3-dehydratase [Streptomyces cadmiisoli]KOV71418.1 NDP-hexose 2,3-dehydratase [Streptomyces sp. AS58]
MSTVALLRPRTAQDLPARLARSAAATGEGHRLRTEDVPGWLAERARAHRFTVRRVPLDELDHWSFAPGTGDLVHRSGRFFAVRGLSARVDEGPIGNWQQPVIHQPEVGILGILAKEFDGVLHFLMQAKMEPGNPNLLQLSPTVQATRSNYQRVHAGSSVRYLEHFTDAAPEWVLADSLQSEHGAWFYRKANRNMLVEAADAEVPPAADYCWLTLGQLGELLRLDNVVNMDARTVLGCLPLPAAEPGARHSDLELLSWFTSERARHDVDVRLMPLAEVEGWTRDADAIRRPDGRFFQVTGVAVEAGNREVGGWSQPLIEPCGTGVAAFLFRRLGGVAHLLVHARVEAGYLNRVELAPTVQCAPRDWEAVPAADRPRFLEAALRAERDGAVTYSAVHSEEGGRFLDACVRYLFVEADEDTAPIAPPRGYTWATVGQLNSLAAHGHYLNIQARTLLACVNSGAARL